MANQPPEFVELRTYQPEPPTMSVEEEGLVVEGYIVSHQHRPNGSAGFCTRLGNGNCCAGSGRYYRGGKARTCDEIRHTQYCDKFHL